MSAKVVPSGRSGGEDDLVEKVLESLEDTDGRALEMNTFDDKALSDKPGSNENKIELVPVNIETPKHVAHVKVPLKVWLTLLISSVGVFMASVSTSALIIAFPVILVDLRMEISTLMWILLVVMLVICGVAGASGKLGDILGQATLYKFGYFVFVVSALGGGFSQRGNKGYDMLVARLFIGLGAAFLFTNSSAIITNAFAPYKPGRSVARHILPVLLHGDGAWSGHRRSFLAD